MLSNDDSLAKGLTKRFIRENQKSTTKLLNSIQRESAKIKTRKQWDRFIKNTCKNNSAIINSYIGGSRRKPYFCISFFDKGTWNPMDEHHATGGWPEDSLYENFIIFQFNGHAPVLRGMVKYIISHHAVQRIFQRLRSNNVESSLWEPAAIFGEIQHLSLWSSVWCHVLGLLDPFNLNLDYDDLSFPFPGNQGLFIGAQPNGTAGCFLRTYVGDEKLSETQLAVRNLLLDASKDLHNSSFCYSPEIIKNLIEEHSWLIFQAVLHRISKSLDLICDHITRDCKSNTAKIELYNAMTNIIELHSDYAPEITSDLLLKHGEKEVLLFWTQHVERGRSERLNSMERGDC